ncbi:hypothetical protein SISSUDRAFT_418042 [Sistotremastrum suecicum HHB10207 ss-3]|uniref:Uncharacterized protein n=1 Tax=Sistotremastrum suecicum HHB10207 ss-3 TaxID=1314776 RepID=A0A165YMA0_9AGAM|nr:hypothetical protein SISSUDRAFT_418042 [Sistotremastrum suecicum HHB10207 ss-3]
MFSQISDLGHRGFLFWEAVKECRRLLQSRKTAELKAILASVDRSRLLRSLVRNPAFPWWKINDIGTAIIHGFEWEILDEMSDFLTELPELEFSAHFNVLEFLVDLSKGLPADFHVPLQLDLSRIVGFLARHPRVRNWREQSDAMMFYLDHCDIWQLSQRTSVFQFLRLCTDRLLFSEEPPEKQTSQHTRDLAAFYFPNFTRLPKSQSYESTIAPPVRLFGTGKNALLSSGPDIISFPPPVFQKHATYPRLRRTSRSFRDLKAPFISSSLLISSAQSVTSN